MARIDMSLHQNRFIMLGVIHRDREVAPLLSRWMEVWEPAIVTLELSPYGCAFRKSKGFELKERVHRAVEELRAQGRHIDGRALDDVLAYIDLPPELMVAADFAKRRGIPLHLIDVDLYSRSRLRHIDKLVSRENLSHLLCGADLRGADQEKALARLFFRGGVKLFPYTEEMAARDTHMRDTIAGLMKLHHGPRLLHICGWQHLADPRSLYASLNPTKVFIHDETLRL